MNPKYRFIINLVLAAANAIAVALGIMTRVYPAFSIVCSCIATLCFVVLATWAWSDMKK